MKKILLLLAVVLSMVYSVSSSDGRLDLLWSYEPNGYVNEIYIVDQEGDGVNEIIASTKEGYVYSLGHKAKSRLNWQDHLKGDVTGLVVTDFDGDGQKEVLAGSDQTTNNLASFDILGQREGGTLEFLGVILSLDAADMDVDGKKDFVIGALSKSVYAVASLATGEKVIWEYETGGPVYNVFASDIDADGATEVVALSIWNEDGQERAQVYALNRNGILEWEYPVEDAVFRSAARPIEVSDINNDGKEEVVIGTKKGALVLSSAGSVLWEFPTEKLVNAVYVGEMKGMDDPAVFIGATPYAYALDSKGKSLWKYPVETTISSFASADLDNDGSSEVLIGSLKYVYTVSDSGKLIDSLFFSGDISAGQTLGVKSMDAKAIAAGDMDGDGLPEAVIGYGWEDVRADTKYYLGDIRVYTFRAEENGEEPEVTTTSKTTQKEASTTTTRITGTTIEEKPEASDDSSLMMLGGLVVVGLILIIIVGVVLFLALRKKKA